MLSQPRRVQIPQQGKRLHLPAETQPGDRAPFIQVPLGCPWWKLQALAGLQNTLGQISQRKLVPPHRHQC